LSAIFLSHSSHDDATAGAVREWLRSEGYETIFLDHHECDGIGGGEAWEERLYTELRRCRALIALVSPNWVASPWCVVEVSYAHALRKTIIPLRIADLGTEAYGRQEPPVLHRVQALDWRRGEAARARLRDALVRAGLDPKNLFAWRGDREPYPGLAVFDQVDSPVYFGREQEITDLLAILSGCRGPGRPRLVLVQGSSGTGKSSLVRAGVLPRLQRDPDRWLVVPPFRPLREPLRELVDALTIAAAGALPGLPSEISVPAGDRSAWLDWLTTTVGDLRRRNGRLEATVLLTVDQLEEALGDAGGNGHHLLLTLRDALAGSDHRFLAVATLRADFVSTLHDHPALREPASNGEMLSVQSFQLGPMPRMEFHRVIEGPAELAGLELEPGLTSRLVDEARSDDALPLLAFVLRELWDTYGKKNLKLSHKDYESFGGLENAVGARAEQIFAELNPTAPEIEAFRATLLSGMIELSSDARILRRRMPSAKVPEQASRLVAAFAAPTARLLLKGEDSLEVAHEALFRRWTMLNGWIAAEIDQLRSRQRVENAYRAWKEETGDKHSRLLPPGRPLAEAEELLKNPLVDTTELEDFIRASFVYNDSRARSQRLRTAQLYVTGGMALLYVYGVILSSFSIISMVTQIILFCMSGVALRLSRNLTTRQVVFVTTLALVSIAFLGQLLLGRSHGVSILSALLVSLAVTWLLGLPLIPHVAAASLSFIFLYFTFNSIPENVVIACQESICPVYFNTIVSFLELNGIIVSNVNFFTPILIFITSLLFILPGLTLLSRQAKLHAPAV
jgi:hypothetical protein